MVDDVARNALAIHDEDGCFAAVKLRAQAVALRNILQSLVVGNKRLTIFAKACSVVSCFLLLLDALLHLQKGPQT